MSLNVISQSVATANGKGLKPGFSKPDTCQAVNSSIELLTTWIHSEYADDKGEKLFARHSQDGAVINATIILVNE